MRLLSVFVLIFALGCKNSHAESAVAVGHPPDFGWALATAHEKSSKAEAELKALEACSGGPLGANDCEILGRVFHNECIAVAVQVSGNGMSASINHDLNVARVRATAACETRGRPCKVQQSFCDGVAERVPICTEPVFVEEMRLKSQLDGSSRRTKFVTSAILYLRSRYCRGIDEDALPKVESTEGTTMPLCSQYSGTLHGETVYWGSCL